MDTSTEQETLEPVRDMVLIDVSGVRDSGMQALVLLARSLDWNVHQKVNNPVILTSRSGVQRRIPTNTSIRMSVFQTHLSSIMLHSTLEATPELMEKIIKSVKPNREQANRLREAVGMSVQEHRRQSEEPIPPAAEPGNQPLVQTIEIQWEEPPMTETNRTIELPRVPYKGTTPLANSTLAPKGGLPADGNEHGEVVKRGPFIATVHSNDSSGGYVYESQSSFERIWSDGYYDYECMICTAAYPSAKGVGSHRQVHVKYDGAEGLVQAEVIKASKRRPTEEERAWIIKRDHGGVDPVTKPKKTKTKTDPDVETAKKLFTGTKAGPTRVPPSLREPVPDVIAANAKPREVLPEEDTTPKDIEPSLAAFAEVPDADDRIQRVLEILLPEATQLMAILTEENQNLRIDNEALRAERDKLRSDLSTLKDLIGGLGA